MGRQAEVIGKNIDISWIYVRNPSDPSTSCWLFTDLVDVDGNLEMLPVVGPPGIMVTDIKVRIDPPSVNVGCNDFPQYVSISADITTNGPLVVTWYWESSTGLVSDQKQVLFEAGETKTVQDYYLVPRAGEYSIFVRSAPLRTARRGRPPSGRSAHPSSDPDPGIPVCPTKYRVDF